MSVNGENEVSAVDTANLEIIRTAVTSLMKLAGSTITAGQKVLDIAPQDHGGVKPYVNPTVEVITIDIDPNSGASLVGDICTFNPLLQDSSFDSVVCTEVLEHVDNPFLAVKEISRVLKKGGVLYASSPLDFRIHGPLPDNWRFTEHGWKVLLRSFSMVTIRAVNNPDRFLMPIHYSVVAVL